MHLGILILYQPNSVRKPIPVFGMPLLELEFEWPHEPGKYGARCVKGGLRTDSTLNVPIDDDLRRRPDAHDGDKLAILLQ